MLRNTDMNDLIQPFSSNDPTSGRSSYDIDSFLQKLILSPEAAGVILHSNRLSRHRCDAAAAAYLRFKRLR